MLLRSAQNRHLLLRRLFSAPTPAPSSSSARAFHPHLARYYTAMAAAEFSVPAGGAVTPKLLFRQLFEKESSTYTYLLADVGHPDRPALLIDPVDRTVDRDLSLTKDLELKLIYALNTHCHADHVTGTGLIKTKMPIVKSIISKASGAKADLFVEAGDRVYFGNLFLERKYKDRQVRRGSSPRTSHRLPLCCHHCFQLYDDRAFLQHKHGVQFHSYASEAASCDLPLQGIDEMSKNIFLDVTNKFEKALGMPQEEKTSVNSIDISAVNQFAEVVVTTRGNATATFCETLVCHEDFKVRNRELQQKMQECASYIQSGHASVEHLRVLYDMLGTSGLHPNVWTFNIISSGLCSLGHMESALWFMAEMCRQGYIPSFHSLSRLMKKSLRLDALDVSLSLLDYMLRYDYFPTLSVLYSLISSLSRVRRIVEAYYIFSFLLDYGIYPRVYTYNPILFALCKSGELFVALSIFCFVGKKGYAYNVYSYTALVLGFCEKKLWRDAYWTLKQMQGNGCKPSSVTYTMLIKCLCDDGKVKEALDVLDMMSKGGCNADLLVYNVIIRALCSHNMISEVCEVMQAASNKGLSPDAFSLSALAGGLVKAGKVGHAVACLSYTSNRGFPGDVVFWNIYFHCLCCDNKSKEALFLLRKKMEEGFIPNVVTYNTILKGYCKEQNIDEALQLFDHFEWPNGGPDLISFNIVLSAACKQRSSLMIQRILHCMDHTGVKLDVMSSVCLVQYFCKVRRLSDCVGVLEYICSSESINRASYNVLLRSLFKEGYKYDKISCFKEGNKSDKIS